MAEISTLKQYGYNLIPVKLDKSPDLSEWKKYQKEKYTGELFDKVGVICGEISYFLEVFDFDNHDGGATERLKEFLSFPLVKEIYEKHELPLIKTQSGGYHLYTRCKALQGGQKLAQKLLNGKPDTIIETRGEGNYVLAPPTPGYKLIRNSFEHYLITQEERNILIQYAKSFNEIDHSINEKRHYPKLKNDVAPWEIYNSQSSSIEEAKELLRQSGWVGMGNKWRRPGKEKGISATFGKVADNVFYVFTDNAYPFERDISYTPYAIKSLLQYDGDYSACAKELMREYKLDHSEKIKEIKEDIKQGKDLTEIERIIKDRKIDFNKKYTTPPVYMSIYNDPLHHVRIFTPENISAITGKAKSKKTFFQTMLIASAIENGIYQQKIRTDLPHNKRRVLVFDTEQALHDVARVANRVKRMTNKGLDNLEIIGLRGIDADMILQIIDYYFTKFNDIGMFFIDQVADLARSINDEEEAVKIVRKLEQISQEKNCHICCVIHQNKGDNYASGWLGSQIQKKAESVISVERRNKNISIIKPALTRNMEFEDFGFTVNENGLPIILGKDEFNTENEI